MCKSLKLANGIAINFPVRGGRRSTVDDWR
jgi:hypothetical protein